jgi:NitT/TauT family transport system substrate-binding protein
MKRPTAIGLIGAAGLGVIGLVAVAVAVATWQENIRPATLRLAVSAWPTSRLIHSANYYHYFPRNLNLEILDKGPYYTATEQALASGQADAAILELSDAGRLTSQGVPLKIVAVIDYTKTEFSMVARAGILDLKDLKGGRLVIEAGSASEIDLFTTLQAAGLKTEDINIQVLEETEALALFLAGEADAIVIAGPIVGEANSLQGSHVLDASEDPFNLSADVVVFRQDYLEAEPARATAFLAGWFKMIDDMNRNENQRRQILSILALKQGVTMREVVAQLADFKLFSLSENLGVFSSDVNVLSLRQLALNNASAAQNTAPFNLDDILDATYLNKLSDLKSW